MDDNDILNDKHLLFAKNMLDANTSNIKRQNLIPLKTNNISRKTKIVFLMLPCWGIFFPPYNIARLSAVTRAAGYETIVYDLNVESFHHLRTKIPKNYWDYTKHWVWESNYEKDIHPFLEPFFKTYLKKIADINPDVIGFSMYYTNREPSNWFAKELKKLLPKTKIIVGGPICQDKWYSPTDDYDHKVTGEGEQVILDFLDKIENDIPITEKNIVSKFNQRLDIDSLPFPDYSDYNFRLYTTPHGISAEISRGCVAKCSFCTETHFWKYRYRGSKDIVDEIEHQQETYGSIYFWFIDSLVNGNLKELRDMAKKIIDKNITIGWQGYARCDGRMDRDYFLDLKNSGCELLSFGIESGSQKVLDLMKKKIKVDEIDQNLIDCKAVGIKAHTNWIVGFPNEDHEAFADTLMLLWRHRFNIDSISPGMTCGDATGTDFEWSRHLYNMNDYDKPYLDNWYTKDFSNTKVNRLIRLKLFHIFFTQCQTHGTVQNGSPRDGLRKHYKLKTYNDPSKNNIDYKDFDYNIIKDDINPVANSVMNEIWVLLRLLWLVYGKYSIKVSFNPAIDKPEFGDYITSDYSSNHEFSIDENGSWTAKHSYNFNQTCKNVPFDVIDYSFDHSWEGTGIWTR